MNDNIKAGAEMNSGDGGYEIGTEEDYNEFVKMRNRSEPTKEEDSETTTIHNQ